MIRAAPSRSEADAGGDAARAQVGDDRLYAASNRHRWGNRAPTSDLEIARLLHQSTTG